MTSGELGLVQASRAESRSCRPSSPRGRRCRPRPGRRRRPARPRFSRVASLSTSAVLAGLVEHHAAVAVRGVFAEAGVDGDRQLGHGLLDGADRPLDDALGVPGLAADLVLLLGQPEQQHRGDAQLGDLLGLARPARRPTGGTARAARRSRLRTPLPGTTNSGYMKLSGDSVVSRTMRRRASVRRRRRGRVSGNDMAVSQSRQAGMDDSTVVRGLSAARQGAWREGQRRRWRDDVLDARGAGRPSACRPWAWAAAAVVGPMTTVPAEPAAGPRRGAATKASQRRGAGEGGHVERGQRRQVAPAARSARRAPRPPRSRGRAAPPPVRRGRRSPGGTGSACPPADRRRRRSAPPAADRRGRGPPRTPCCPRARAVSPPTAATCGWCEGRRVHARRQPRGRPCGRRWRW